MKHLKVEYTGTGGTVILFDGDVDEVVWSDGVTGVTVSGKVKRAGGGSNFLEKLAAATKKPAPEGPVEPADQPAEDPAATIV